MSHNAQKSILLRKGDKVQLTDGRIGEVIKTWGVARCHAEVRMRDGKILFIIAERDVQQILRHSRRGKGGEKENG